MTIRGWNNLYRLGYRPILRAVFALVFLVTPACEDPLHRESRYEDQLVVFGHLVGEVAMDTIYVSRSFPIDEPYPEGGPYLSGASVKLRHLVDGLVDTTFGVVEVPEVAGVKGRYLSDIIPAAGATYRLTVSLGDDSVMAETTVPQSFELYPAAGWWDCDGEMVYVDSVALSGGEFPPDTVIYREADCYVQSFASVPLMQFRRSEDHPSQVWRILVYALEADVLTDEPYEDLNLNGRYDEGEPYDDLNISGRWDHYLVNAIIDTSHSANDFKGRMRRDENGNLYRMNPTFINLAQPEIDLSWLFFNYYGLHLVVIQATDDAFDNYFAGDPFQFNQYLLPHGNIQGGLGLFSSSYLRYFFIYVHREDDIQTRSTAGALRDETIGGEVKGSVYRGTRLPMIYPMTMPTRRIIVSSR